MHPRKARWGRYRLTGLRCSTVRWWRSCLIKWRKVLEALVVRQLTLASSTHAIIHGGRIQDMLRHKLSFDMLVGSKCPIVSKETRGGCSS